jgi:hypothetical protein
MCDAQHVIGDLGEVHQMGGVGVTRKKVPNGVIYGVADLEDSGRVVIEVSEIIGKKFGHQLQDRSTAYACIEGSIKTLTEAQDLMQCGWCVIRKVFGRKVNRIH